MTRTNLIVLIAVCISFNIVAEFVSWKIETRIKTTKSKKCAADKPRGDGDDGLGPRGTAMLITAEKRKEERVWDSKRVSKN